MAIRPAKLGDIEAIVELAVESVSRAPLPVRIDRDGMRGAARQLVGHPSHFIRVVEQEGRVVGCLAALVQPGFWFRGTQASILMFYVRVPGLGVALMREFARWVTSRPSIKLAVFELEPDMDPRIERCLARLGFGRKSSNMTYVRQAK